MGRSPGKWIKTVLFGKKHSKSNPSRNATIVRKAAAEPAAEDLADPVISNPCQYTDKGAASMEFEKGTSGTIALLPVDQGLETRSNFFLVSIGDDQMRRQHQAATKAQAVFRGYLARRDFRALKGIIRLQALIRGHLVRRQAVATLRCMQAIVKLQAMARKRSVQQSNTMLEVGKKYSMEVNQVDTGADSSFGSVKLVTNAYVRKILLSLQTAMPLSLQYDQAEQNSAWNWLERWSVSHFWEPSVRPRKVPSKKPQKKQIGSQLLESEAGKSKRTIRKASGSANEDYGALGTIETDKPKRHLKKVTSNQTELVQEQPQNEFERVKRNSRKVSASVTVGPEKSETESEKPQQQPSLKAVLNPAPDNVPAKETVISTENHADSDVIVEKIAKLGAPSKSAVAVGQVDVTHDDRPHAETHSLENGDKINSPPFLNDEVGPKEGESDKKNQKMRRRRLTPVKQEYPENISLNTPSLPSYMVATQSAKAKLRVQGSSNFTEDGAEVGYVRRHSLPASTNGKLNSLSPRIQKPVQANISKGSSKNSRPVTSCRDDKVLQPGWRR